MANEIWHHGIKGQRWGIRRTDAQLGHPNSSSKEASSHEDYKRAHAKKDVSQMSDQELRNTLNRLNMEKQYKDLSPNALGRGKKVLGSTLKAVGTVAATSASVITIAANYKKISEWFK